MGLVYTVTVLLSANNLCSGSDILCHRYVVEEGDTLAGIALRYQALIVKRGGREFLSVLFQIQHHNPRLETSK